MNLLDPHEKKAYVKKTIDTTDKVLALQKKHAGFKEDMKNSGISSSKNEQYSDTEKGSLPRTKKYDSQADLSGVESNNTELRSVSMKDDLKKKKAEIETKLKTIKEQEEKLQQSLGVRSSRKLDYSNMDISNASEEGFDFDRELARANRGKAGIDSEKQSRAQREGLKDQDRLYQSDKESSQFKESKTSKFNPNQTVIDKSIDTRTDNIKHDKQDEDASRKSNKKDASTGPKDDRKDDTINIIESKPSVNDDIDNRHVSAIDDKGKTVKEVTKDLPKKAADKDALDIDFFADDDAKKEGNKDDKKQEAKKDAEKKADPSKGKEMGPVVEEKDKKKDGKGKDNGGESGFWDDGKPKEKEKPIAKTVGESEPKKVDKKDDPFDFGDDEKGKKKDDSFDFLNDKSSKPKVNTNTKPVISEKPKNDKPNDDINFDELLGDAVKPPAKKPEEKKPVVDNNDF